MIDKLRDNTIFFDWYYNGESLLTQQFFAKHSLNFVSASATYNCYVTGITLGQALTQHSLYQTAEQFNCCKGILTTDWINHTLSHGEHSYFNFASGAVLAWTGCDSKFSKTQSLSDFQKAYAFQKYGTTDSALLDYLKFGGDFCSDLVSLFPATLRGIALRKVAFFNDNPLLFTMTYSPYLKGENLKKYASNVKKLNELYAMTDKTKQDEYFFANEMPLIIHNLLLARYQTFESAYEFYDKAAKCQFNNQKLFEENLSLTTEKILNHKKDFEKPMEFANKMHRVLGMETAPILRLKSTLKNLDKLAAFILSLKDNHRVLPTFFSIYKFLFSHPQHGYWEAGVNDWINEKPKFASFDIDENMAAAAPRGFASEIDFKTY